MMDDFECGTCGKVFLAGWKARDQHLRSTGHRAPEFECYSCPRLFRSEQARFQHMNAVNHFSWECSICDQTWPTEPQRDEHEKDDHNYCKDCQRSFMNQNNLKMHLNSRIHRGENIQCPFCKRHLTTATGLTHHLETGSCPNASGLNRDTMYKIIRSKDPGGALTKNLIGWHGSTQYKANDLAYNRRLEAWECYLCHKLFGNLPSLNQHLNSPTHQQSLYHCPKRICRREFKSLAAIINHLESESCGYTRFDNVQRSIQGMVGGDRLISFY